MAQQIFSRTVCDWCLHVKGIETVFERNIADDIAAGGPEYQRTLRVGELTKTVDMCPDCDREVLEPLRSFLERFGVDVVGRRPGRPPTKTPPPAVSAPSPTPRVTPPTVTVEAPATLFVAPTVAATPPPTNGRTHEPSPLLARPAAPPRTPVEKQGTGDMYPCPLCDGVAFLSAKGITDHVKVAHGLTLDQVVGADCHFCGKAMDSYLKLASHFGIRHRADAYSGRTLAESMILARDNGDPHGTVAARMEALAVIQRERMQTNGPSARTAHAAVS